MTELGQYPTVQNWVNRLSESSKETYLSYFGRFIQWLETEGGAFKDYSPDQLVEHQRKADNGSRYEIIDLAQLYINQYKGRVNTKNTAYGTIRSFFMHNRAELPKDPSFMIRSKKPPIVGTLTPEEIKLAILSCKPAYQAAYLVMFQAALDHQMFMYWNMNGYDDLVKQLRENPDVIKIELPGRKKNRNEKPYYSFISTDAIEALRNWLQLRPENAQGIITNQFGEPLKSSSLKTYWIRHLRKIGIVELEKGKQYTERTGKNLHEMRDVYRSLWSKSPANHIVGEYCMGHSIDPLSYDKSFRDIEYYREEYRKAAPYLNLLSRGEAFGQVEAKELNRVESQLKARIEQLESEKEDSLAAMKAEQAEIIRELVEIRKQLKPSA